ncbi:MAG: hypothetical protein DWG80_01090 [Chloroflexi bacterium]|nr:hypothetical protein [Chloroflexota bacterium]
MGINAETWMGTMGMIFVLVLMGLAVWFIATMGKKSMDLASAKAQARAAARGDQEMQRIAREAVQAQDRIMEQIQKMETTLDARLSEVERMLREVDEPSLTR